MPHGPHSDLKSWNTYLPACGGSLVPVFGNLVDVVWGAQRPAVPQGRIIVQPISLSGESHLDKIERLREHLRKEKATACLVAALDEVAWLFNLRGGDVRFTPVFWSYGIVTLDDVALYVDTGKFSDDVRDHLTTAVRVEPYDKFIDDVRALAADRQNVCLVVTVLSLLMHTVLTLARSASCSARRPATVPWRWQSRTPAWWRRSIQSRG